MNKAIKVPKGAEIESTGKGVLMLTASLFLVAGGIWGVSKLTKIQRDRERQNDALDQALTVGSPEYYANVIHIAIDGFGTDEEAIYNAFREMPTQAFVGRVIQAYRDLTGANMNEDLNDDLSSSELQKVANIIRNKPLS